MLLKNFYRAVFVASLKPTTAMPINTGTRTYNMCRPADASSDATANNTVTRSLYEGLGFIGMSEVLATSATKARAVLGTGTTAPTFDEYEMSGEIITTISSIVSSNSHTVEEDGVAITTTWTVTNTGTEAITIGEVGFYGTYKTATAVSNSSTAAMLIERTVLDEPITIEAGGVGQVTYTVRLKYPTS